MNDDIAAYNNRTQPAEYRAVCELLAAEIHKGLPDAQSKLWHGSPVWFLAGNPIVGYGMLKHSVRLLFWSGQSFGEQGLQPEGSFKAAEARYTNRDEVDLIVLRRWLNKSRLIQWDYKHIVKRRGVLERIL